MKRITILAVLAVYLYVAFRYVNWYCPRNPALDDGGMWHVKFASVALTAYVSICCKHRFEEFFLGLVFWGSGSLFAGWAVTSHYYCMAATEGWFRESSVAGTELIDRYSSDLTSCSVVVAITLGLIIFYFFSRAVQNKEREQ